MHDTSVIKAVERYTDANQPNITRDLYILPPV